MTATVIDLDEARRILRPEHVTCLICRTTTRNGGQCRCGALRVQRGRINPPDGAA